ncbi:MAG TPA: SDR family oxidoreductase [Bryobacteraceae bacterium]|nr:SDR family oxidoreductase [Bryobacteraceae bacterium]
MNRRYAVTGGAGFIGSALVRGLLRDGAEKVTVIDNFLSGSEKNLGEVRDRIAVARVDIRDYESLLPAMQGADIVFHLAAIPSVPRSILEPVPSHEVNINGTFNVLRAAAESGVKRVVYAASSSAYGDTDVLPKVESMAPRPKSPYAVQKLLGEHYISVFASCFGLEGVALRFFNVYGPRQDPSSAYSGVLSKFMTALLSGQSPMIHGDGTQTRDFTYVEDVVGLILKASNTSGVSGNVYNAGNGNRYSLNEVWAALQKIEGVNLPQVYGPWRDGDVRDSQADTTRAVRELGHKPQFTLEEGLRRTLEWYRADQQAAVEAR